MRKTKALLLAIIPFFLFTCQTEPLSQNTTPIEVLEQYFKLSPSAHMPSTSPILFQFTQKIDKKRQALVERQFHSHPKTRFGARWVNDDTVILKPSKPLIPGQQYQFSLDIGQLLPESEHQSIALPVKVLKNYWKLSDYQFKSQSLEGEKQYIFEGTIQLNEGLDTEALKNQFFLKKGFKKVSLKIESTSSDNEYSLISEPIANNGQKLQYQLLQKSGVPLFSANDTSVSYDPQKTMEALSLKDFQTDDQIGLEVLFSQSLSTRQDFASYIKVKPNVKLDVQAKGSKLTVYGAFESGTRYKVEVLPGVLAKNGSASKNKQSHQVQFEDIYPKIEFESQGMFLPSSGKAQLAFKSINVQNALIRIYRVNEWRDVFSFLRYRGNNDFDVNEKINSDYVQRLGDLVFQRLYSMGSEKNLWKRHVLQLQDAMQAYDDGLYFITINFAREDMLFNDDGSYREGQTTHPNSPRYLYQHGRIFKPLMLSDLGMSLKKTGSEYHLHVHDVKTLKPVKNARVHLRDYYGDSIRSDKTDGNGYVKINGDSSFRFFTAEYDDHYSFINPDMSWSTSTLDLDGVDASSGSAKVFIFTERGVYRPGDDINAFWLARLKDDVLPASYPVSYRFFNPRYQEIANGKLNRSDDSFYALKLKTSADDPTGTYNLRVMVGNQRYNHDIKVETVIPNRLKVLVYPDKKQYQLPASVSGKLESRYLFGAPSSSLEYELEYEMKPIEKRFKQYPSFTFTHKGQRERQSKTLEIASGELDQEGLSPFSFSVPEPDLNSAALLTLKARVFEKGGQYTDGRASIEIDGFNYYVGVEPMSMRWGYADIDEPYSFQYISLDAEGKVQSGRKLKFRLYHNERYWWWEYRDERDPYDFTKMSKTALVQEGDFSSGSRARRAELNLPSYGRYLLEIEDEESGHSTAFFFNASWWGSGDGENSASQMLLKTDKKSYHTSDSAKVRFPAGNKGLALISIERGSDIIYQKQMEIQGKDGEALIELPLNDQMVPNAYLSISYLQAHAQTANDRPLRMYGIIPLKVEDPETKLTYSFETSEFFRPGEPFTVEINTAEKTSSHVVLAVVDEGLLDLTRFQTPDPYDYFNKKERYINNNYDNYDAILGAIKGDAYQTLSIGGDGYYDEMGEEKGARKAKRFIPVSMTKGPFKTDRNGYARVTMEMPEYLGSVRVMAIGSDDKRFGNAEKAVPVKTEVMVYPTLPRVLGPGEQFRLPFTVFAMEESIQNVQVHIKTEGPVSIQGPKVKTLDFTSGVEKDSFFTLISEPAVGIASVKVLAIGDGHKNLWEREIQVRPSSPRIYKTESQKIGSGETKTFAVPDDAIRGSMEASLKLVRVPYLNFQHRIDHLIRYPYGCIEQTTSSVLPQLFLGSVIKLSDRESGQIDDNIEAGLQRLRTFQTPGGGLAYWPGGDSPSSWGNNYAGYFMLKASAKGYRIPSDLYDSWLAYQRRMKRSSSDNYSEHIYRLYLLAMAGESDISALNQIHENKRLDLAKRDRWLLAGAYALSGETQTARKIRDDLDTDIRPYRESGGTYGSDIRDKAIVLSVLLDLDEENTAEKVFTELCQLMSSKRWYSTQTLGYSLTAIGQYIETYIGDQGSEYKLKITTGEGTQSLNIVDQTYTVDLKQELGKTIRIEHLKPSPLSQIYASVEWSGVPLVYFGENENKNMDLEVQWFDSIGKAIDVSSVKQGESIFGLISLEVDYSGTLDEVAVAQMIPSGWQLENLRLSGESWPSFMQKPYFNQVEYMDIRDDRIHFFLDARGNRVYHFGLKATAITAGSFILPPTQAEAMYDRNYIATQKGQRVEVVGGQ